MLQLAVFLVFVAGCVGQGGNGWAMKDRFYGFRYEISDAARLPQASTALQAHADEEGCFGWVQRSKIDSWVGEVRCSKQRGQEFEKWLKEYADNRGIEVLVYEDTKIRLHFSHFKIVEPERDTCFLESPHVCPPEEFEEEGGGGSGGGTGGGGGGGGGARGDEL